MILKIEIIEYQQHGHKQATFKACTADALAMNEKGKREFSSLMELTERIKKTVEAYYSEVNSTRDARNRVTGAGEQGNKRKQEYEDLQER